MVFESTLTELSFLAARVLFGGLLAFMGINHFTSVESLAAYTEAKGIPAPKVAVVGSGVMLVLGSLSIMIGVYPMIGGLLVLAFLIPVSIGMHDFWSFDDPEQRQNEMTQFFKNMALAGGALMVIALSEVEWPYALEALTG